MDFFYCSIYIFSGAVICINIMTNEQTNEADKKGEEVDKAVAPVEKPLNPIERSEAVLKGMKEQVDRYEVLVKANVEAAATSMLGGSAGGHVETPQLTEEEQASRKRIKAVADVKGSSWGKKYE